ncbi:MULTISPECIES: glycoside hydrolase family 5 protein [unclassified Duganella]|uniref:glycoside hydrolase family 5 protein n=1 Tax=unclassified Duganella TaxID=2636909 RepID=UPI0006FFBCF7|nr:MULTISPECIES: glycoside hydrolase family 5 protein [unclassified Duganella]KQV61471.1 glycosyl hydrolase family 5 [Duganella sp. Root336D2]KRB92439.1 glycosyl hydrolase family 5 [Duganella sp. Root198D2]
MRPVLTRTVFALALSAAPFAHAQNCGSGGGATVCLNASASGSDVRLNWSVSGAVSGLQVYRDTDSDPNGRSRIAALGKSATSYTDNSAAAGTVYWYWIKFSTGGGSFSSGAAHAVRVGVMRNLSSMQLSAQMAPGWNLGNSLEATGGTYVWGSSNFNETGWGNPRASQALFHAVKAAGFKSVRIPVSWKQYADADDNISPQWMERVTEVVNYAHSAGLVAMINIHWDGGWMQPTYARQSAANARLAKFWTQIANNFKNHDDTLLFAGTNEVMVDGNYQPPTAEYCDVQKGFNQAFISAVRATGGNNASRHLVVQAFNTNINHANSCNAAMPGDRVANRMMMEVHYYDPFDFALDEKSTSWKWGQAANPSGWANEAYADSQFQMMKTGFIDKGVPVLLGEFGAIVRTEYDPAGIYRKSWDQYITRAAFTRGIVPMYWDNGYTGNHQMGLFDRASGAQAFPDVIGSIVNASK